MQHLKSLAAQTFNGNLNVAFQESPCMHLHFKELHKDTKLSLYIKESARFNFLQICFSNTHLYTRLTDKKISWQPGRLQLILNHRRQLYSQL